MTGEIGQNYFFVHVRHTAADLDVSPTDRSATLFGLPIRLPMLEVAGAFRDADIARLQPGKTQQYGVRRCAGTSRRVPRLMHPIATPHAWSRATLNKGGACSATASSA